ncbi:hypothetical protein IWQ62_004225 [Dispira parvispora]|uniref:Pre-mRNA-splicing factor SPF27 n=1 Tax=Dispira parvispora TaxID=1520584 RepID=A0A9W8AM12_9FUNG|nr:hypothetical protein IWQ62_004225 [Dispira parvispora]
MDTALPYIDTQYDDPAVRAQVDALIAQEVQLLKSAALSTTAKSPSSPLPLSQIDSYLAEKYPPISLFTQSPALHTEFERVSQGRKLPALDTHRYTLPTPQDDEPHPNGSVPKDNQVTQWAKAVANAKAQLQHQQQRLDHLERMQTSHADTHTSTTPFTRPWETTQHHLQRKNSQLQQALDAVEQAILDINRTRQTNQQHAHPKLTALEQDWMESTTRSLQLEFACTHIEQELQRMQDYEQQLLAKHSEAH